jgi:hypothetical protein
MRRARYLAVLMLVAAAAVLVPLAPPGTAHASPPAAPQFVTTRIDSGVVPVALGQTITFFRHRRQRLQKRHAHTGVGTGRGARNRASGRVDGRRFLDLGRGRSAHSWFPDSHAVRPPPDPVLLYGVGRMRGHGPGNR